MQIPVELYKFLNLNFRRNAKTLSERMSGEIFSAENVKTYEFNQTVFFSGTSLHQDIHDIYICTCMHKS